MKLTKDIVPGKSLGGIALQSPVDAVIEGLRSHHVLEVSDGIVSIDDGLVTIGYDERRTIYSVMCNSGFEGRYEGKLWAGMTVSEVLKNSTTQVAWGGAVVVDGIEGIGLPLPDGFDDFDQLTDHLPLDHVFEYLSVFLI
ncbi:hypothetical protein SAMN05518669_112191 [Variovorax sp. YR634]|jgi:hypothetical protein|uniref:hypothetical protein n=1 Tax=Variovorax TaxID=34072 RepID=UPI000896241A|nr:MULTISPECIES: hypothetical protein [Variovorax]MDQ0081662.1 hypothetical protein [Variovorax boronicumulans]SDY48646.1 hypothetical protein SAMN05518669_112191 [Variovorax sp. YR634]